MLKFNHGVLGINARNLLYIKPFNQRKDIIFADDKLKTKHFLAARGVSVPKLFGVIRNKNELENFDFNILPNKFVLKPNLGSGGEGIIPIIRTTTGSGWETLSGRPISDTELRQHIVDILDGRFSVNQNLDAAFFEQLIVTHDSLKPYTYKGLPDLRIIVFNLIPIMAMLRLPTKESEGRANMQQGAVGVGLNLATGQTTYIARKHNIVPEIPGLGPIDIKIPFWDEILEIAVKTQLVTNLGYLAADIALDQTAGPVLLEINARAGLKVQIANQAGLRDRLDRVKGLNVKSVAKGIRIAKDLFGNQVEKRISNASGKTIIGAQEKIEILGSQKLITDAKIAITQKETTINQDIAKELKITDKDSKTKLKFIIAGKRITTTFKVDPQQSESIIIGRQHLGNFLIDINKNEKPTLPKSKANSSAPAENPIFISRVNLHEADRLVADIDQQIKLVSRITPINLQEELAKFHNNKDYNPQFVYKQPNLDFTKLLNNLANMKTDDTAAGKLFEDKKQELINRLSLISQVGSQEFCDSAKLNFTLPTKAAYEYALKLTKKNLPFIGKSKGNKITAEEAKKVFYNTLQSYGLTNWQVKIHKNMAGNCSVSKRKSIFIKASAKFSRNYLKRLIAHEIETHVLTNANGAQQPYKLFQIGTAKYLTTQEGLAVYNEALATENDYHLLGARGLIGVYLGAKNSFAATYHGLVEAGFQKQLALKTTVKVKRGLEDTSQPGAFTKSAIYFLGAQKIKNYLANGGSLKDLYFGKIDIDKIDIIKAVDGLVQPVYLPKWYD